VSGPGHERWQDSAGAYVLGALPEDERAGFERHLAECDACRAEVDALQVAADALPMSAPPVAPPAALKDRIMVEVRRDAGLLAAAGPAADRPPERRRRFGRLLPAPLTAALAAAALAVGVVVGAVVFGGGGGERTVVASVDRAQAPRASARLEVQDGRAMLVMQGLPAPSGRRVYQVWLQRSSGAVVPTNSLFSPRHSGAATATVAGSLNGVRQVLVSAEPPGGSRQPTSKPILAARLD
jgi:anti-sigma-K factor RskA